MRPWVNIPHQGVTQNKRDPSRSCRVDSNPISIYGGEQRTTPLFYLLFTDFITKSVDEVLLLGVVQETSKEHFHNVLPLNVNIKKNNGKLRLIFNTMFINQFMVHTFKYPELHKEGREILGNSSWTCGIDISQEFYHIEIECQSSHHNTTILNENQGSQIRR